MPVARRVKLSAVGIIVGEQADKDDELEELLETELLATLLTEEELEDELLLTTELLATLELLFNDELVDVDTDELDEFELLLETELLAMLLNEEELEKLL